MIIKNSVVYGDFLNLKVAKNSLNHQQLKFFLEVGNKNYIMFLS